MPVPPDLLPPLAAVRLGLERGRFAAVGRIRFADGSALDADLAARTVLADVQHLASATGDDEAPATAARWLPVAARLGELARTLESSMWQGERGAGRLGAAESDAGPRRAARWRRGAIARTRRGTYHRHRGEAFYRPLLDAACGFAAETDPRCVLGRLLDGATAAVGADAGAVFRWDAARGALVAVRSTSRVAGRVTLVRPGEGAAGRAIERRGPVILNDYRYAAAAIPAVAAAGVHAVAAVPLQHEGRLLGSLAALTYEPDRRFGPLEAESLELWAGVAAAALVGLERAQLRGVTVTARELADRLNNALALPIGTIELLQHRAHLPPDLHGLLDDAAAGLAEAARCIARLQRVVRLATRDTPHGPALDLERSTS